MVAQPRATRYWTERTCRAWSGTSQTSASFLTVTGANPMTSTSSPASPCSTLRSKSLRLSLLWSKYGLRLNSQPLTIKSRASLSISIKTQKTKANLSRISTSFTCADWTSHKFPQRASNGCSMAALREEGYWYSSRNATRTHPELKPKPFWTYSKVWWIITRVIKSMKSKLCGEIKSLHLSKSAILRKSFSKRTPWKSVPTFSFRPTSTGGCRSKV